MFDTLADRNSAALALAVEKLVRDRLADAGAETGGSTAPMVLCDAIYACWLSGTHPDRRWAPALADKIGRRRLKGSAPRISVHNLAYAIGALRLAEHPLPQAPGDFGLPGMINRSGRPKFPGRHAHNAWRVSHWIGGTPVLARALAGRSMAFRAADVLEAAEGCVVPETGLLRTWRSEILQSVFRRLYWLRHDPRLGDLGGIVHLVWAQQAAGRPVIAADNIRRLTTEALNRTGPFAETRPYCLDFDLLYLLRVCGGPLDVKTEDRVSAYFSATCAFLKDQVPPGYALHSLPGALAALHEAARLVPALEADLQRELCPDGPRDVIETAGWL